MRWRDDPRLRLHPEYPDDLEALFFFPEARRLEKMWVRLDASVADGYEGSLLNQPHTPGLAQGERVLLRPTPGASAPVWMSPTIRDNLRRYRGACEACGFDLVVEPIDALIRAQFPNAPDGAEMVRFTTRCALCSGTQVVSAV